MIFSLPVAAAIIQLVHARVPEYITINVGEGGLHIVHPSLPAAPGDVIVFGFSGPGPTNYSVVQSSYCNPCHYLPNGFYSGFMPVPPGPQEVPLLFLLTINNTDPIYYYSGSIGDCQAGMVATINAPYDESGSFLNYQSAAELVTSVGPLPSVIMGGQFASSYPTGTPTAPSPALITTSSSESSVVCAGGSNKTSNATATPQPVFTSGDKSAYDRIPLTYRELESLLWQLAFGLGAITTVSWLY